MDNIVLFIFRRDFRVHDNTSWNQCVEYSTKNKTKILPIFLVDKQQADKKKNSYFSNSSFQFLHESLQDLNSSHLFDKLCILKNESFLKYVLDNSKVKVVALFTNKDYTPYATYRDKHIEDLCTKNNILFFTQEDYTLLPSLNDVSSNTGSRYSVFTPFYNKASTITVKKPLTTSFDKKMLYSLKSNDHLSNYYHKQTLHQKGGRKHALQHIQSIMDIKNYHNTRDFPSLVNSTSMISAYLKYGCISARELYWIVDKMKLKSKEYKKQIYWRDFYAYIAYHHSHVLQGMIPNNSTKRNGNLREYDIKWKNNKKFFESWCLGKTGVPFVDAGMRQLNSMNYMHNRLRMVTSMFLMKDLHIDWRWGEEYFASKLVDYDPASNNGGWQWSAGTGTDYQNYYRIFNPYTQSKRFDKDTEYIKKWIPELSSVPSKDIHDWENKHTNYPNIYMKPMIIHDIQRKIALKEVYYKPNKK